MMRAIKIRIKHFITGKSTLPLVMVGLIMVLFEVPVLAAVDMSIVASATTMERNSSYSVSFRATPDLDNTDIAQIYAYLTYDNRIFENMTITDRISVVAPGISWETDYVNVAFKTYPDGNTVELQYIKTNTVLPDWEADAQTYTIYRLNFKIKKDALLGNTKIDFTPQRTISDGEGTPITGNVTVDQLTIVQDSTPPVTTANPPGGYYTSNRSVTLSLNETGSIYYTVDNTTPDINSPVYSGPISITGNESALTTTYLRFFGVDTPFTHAPNSETPKLETYYIDREYPLVSFTSPTGGEIYGVGGSIVIEFTVNDDSGQLGNEGRPNYVTVGGEDASWVSGTHTEAYVYQKIVSGDEVDGDIVVMVTDMAGNWSIYTEVGAVTYDTDPPGFINFSFSPDPAYIEELMTLEFDADEILSSANPTVLVGGVSASFSAKESLHYTYKYLASPRNWEASLAFLQDSDPDRDGDGMPNWWENNYDLDPDDPLLNEGADGDPDGDGFSNLAEYRFYQESGRLIDPNGGPSSGGQTISLYEGWNLVSYQINTSWYKGEQPSGLLSGVATEEVTDWSEFFNGNVFKNSGGNFSAVQVQHYGDQEKYYVAGGLPFQNNLDYISPGQGLWIKMNSPDIFILEGSRVKPSGGFYPAIDLNQGWNLVSILPVQSCFQTGVDYDAPVPSDAWGTVERSTLDETLKTAFNLGSVWSDVDSIQMMYGGQYGVRFYYQGYGDWNNLNFVLPGYAAWIKMDDGFSGSLRFTDHQ